MPRHHLPLPAGVAPPADSTPLARATLTAGHTFAVGDPATGANGYSTAGDVLALAPAPVDATARAAASAAQSTANAAIPGAQKGVAGGVATLGTDGKVPSAQLPAAGTSGTDQVARDAASAAQTLAAAAIPAAQKGAANGVATLGTDGKVPAAQLPAATAAAAVAGQTWAPAALTGNGVTATPPTARGITLGEALAVREVNFADFADPNYTTGDKLQAFLDYAGDLALEQKNRVYDDQHMRATVRATFPRGNCEVKDTLVVPEWVEFHCVGTLIRSSQAGSALQTNLYAPIVVFVPTSHCSRLNIQADGGGGGGSGVVFGRSWTVASVAVAAGGTGYAVGNVLTLDQPSRQPYSAATVTVSAIGTGGAVTAVTLSDGGAYARRPAKQPASFGCTGGAGTGARFTPTWAGDWPAPGDNGNGAYAYQAGQALLCDWLIGQIRVSGGGQGNDAFYGPMFGVMLNTMNADVDRIEVTESYAGILYRGVDVRVNFLNAVLSGIGIYAVGGGAFTCPNVVLDSCRQAYISIAHTNGVRLSGRLFWENFNDGYGSPGGSGYAIILGPSGTTTYTDDVTLDFTAANAGKVGGCPIVYMSYTRNCAVRIQASTLDESGAAYTKPFNALAQIGANVDASCVIEGAVTGLAGSIWTGGTPPAGGVRVWDGTAKGWAGVAGTYELYGTAAPTATTGANKAGTGSRYLRTAAPGGLFVNTGTAASPTWTQA